MGFLKNFFHRSLKRILKVVKEVFADDDDDALIGI